MKPYWQSEDRAITVYHARWENVHAAGLAGVPDLVHADPPYGIDADSHRPNTARVPRIGAGKAFPEMRGNAEPFDPAPLLALDRPTVLWGANHYCDKVPGSPSWITWDKRCGTTSDNCADCEHAWSNLGGPARIFRCLWRWGARGPETGLHVHPTQKPIALSTYVFQRAKLKPGALVFVPYLGSGPDLPAARAMGLRVVACDVERWCCDTAIGRLGAITPTRAAEPCGPLFSRGDP